ncbi:MAG: ABC transporter ATP-binding protein [Candidatus Eremiobacteraeota bacterium]|nr:ABC transporter ATP-binding protein [Candidatus Eremiobacteraeota bacterium]
MCDYAIEMNGVHKSYGKQKVLKDMSLHVPRGSIYAFLGRNGEGKSTSIRLMMNLLSPESGTVAILGKDSVKETEYIKSRVGYVPESPHIYDWMPVDALIAFTSRFYPDWDHDRASRLKQSLGIDGSKKVQELSLGTKAKVELLLALAHNPEILILDDCTSGLDALVRREFQEHIVSLVEDGRHTIFFSSHIITELERVADMVGLLRNGSLAFEMPLDELKGKVKKVFISLEEEVSDEALAPFSSSVLRVAREKNDLTIYTRDSHDGLLALLKGLKHKALDVQDMELEDIFVEYTREQGTAGLA